jgi:hypothetical protein
METIAQSLSGADRPLVAAGDETWAACHRG